jgi:hypothetical protein
MQPLFRMAEACGNVETSQGRERATPAQPVAPPCGAISARHFGAPFRRHSAMTRRSDTHTLAAVGAYLDRHALIARVLRQRMLERVCDVRPA